MAIDRDQHIKPHHYCNDGIRCVGHILAFRIANYMLSLARSQSTKLGEVTVGSNLLITSTNVETNYKFVVDSSITTPKISIAISRGSVSTLNDIINQISSSNVVIGEPTPITSAVATTTDGGATTQGGSTTSNVISSSNRVSVTLMTMIGCLFGGVFLTNNQRSGPKTFIAMIVIGVTLSSVVNAIVLDQITVEATITIPPGFRFDSLEIRAGKGSVSMNGVQATSLKVDACTGGLDFPVSFGSLNTQTFNVCTKSAVTATDVQLLGTPSTINLTSKSDKVNIDFLLSYNGQAKVDTNQAIDSTIVGSQSCTLTSSTASGRTVKQGTCGSGSTTNQLNVVAETGATVEVFNAEACPTAADWRDPRPSAAGPVSPSIMTTIPVINNVFSGSTNQWKVLADYNNAYEVTNPSAGTTSNGVDVSGSLKISLGGPTSYWIVSETYTNFLRANQPVQFSYSYLFAQANTASLYASSASICAFVGLEQEFVDDPDHWLPTDPSQYTSVVCFPFPTTNIAGSHTAWTVNTASFTPTQDLSSVRFALNMTYARPWGTIPVAFFKSLTYTIPQRAVAAVSPLSSDSELVKLRKPSTTLTPQSSSSCPHLQTGLLHWHNPATWGGSVPNPSSVITLPANSKVLISSCSLQAGTIYQKIIVPATSELIFSDANITMHLQDMYVQGKLWIGSSSCRSNGNIELIFHGAYTTADTIAQYMGSKGIAAAVGGYLSIQGKQYKNTWTRLSVTAYPYDRLLYLQDAVNWEVGQKIVVTTSRFEDEWYPENEVLTIQAVSANGKTVQTVEPVQFYHYAGQEYQAEVGLLSRRIILRGDAASSEPKKFGGHVLTMGNSQFAGIELINMGQRNMRARYPLHFHLAGTVSNSYVSDCSVHDTYYRCVTIHGTHNLTVTENVAYDATGHCYYIEDGIEENNTVSYNLAAYVHTIFASAGGNTQQGQWFNEQPELTQPADTAAAGYYITNAYNRIYGNAASGGWASYSFPNLPNSIGQFKSVVFSPMLRPTLEFDGNTAHSAGYMFMFGSCVYCGGVLQYLANGSLTYQSGRPADSRDTVFSNGTEAWMQYTNLKAYQCSDGVGHWGERIEVINYESHDNLRSGTVFGSSWLSSAIINGRSGNVARSINSKQGFQFYDTWTRTILTNINFRNFIALAKQPSNPQDDNRVLVSMTHSDIYKPQGISATRNITFTNTLVKQRMGHNVTNTGSSRYYNFVDWDGSFTGRNVPSIVGSHLNWWQYDNTCTLSPEWGIYHCVKGSTAREVGNLDLLIPGIINDVEEDPNTVVGMSNLFGPGIPTTGTRRQSPITNNVGITGVTGMGWYLYVNSGAPTQFQLSTRLVPYGRYIVVAMRYPANTQFSIDQWYQWRTPQAGPKFNATSTFTELLNGNGAAYYFDQTHLYLKVVNPRLDNGDDEAYTRGGASVYTIYTGFFYRVTATCTSCNMQVSDDMPTKWT
ncbi:hypothetical protein DFA_08945 [Cavenderia fasciculata]|uniref:G8 domain-containing protein n=1 Tax=Cavenderia fasciculata TaxID=261658 RepID=F4Q551_CACFS|nr:uncharacterized protein DFA_08945 [Cavenderia fasciculata]EGG17944.1 hypothetical protein DFA_08945 [Cavenderia fasciculata]|eukprot:XP_004356428.1 hypothetical protein DFA_08945 [Cavenderia fasciculata]